jgi:hypothetical protein
MKQKTITANLGLGAMHAVGIDVSKASLSIAVIGDNSPCEFSIKNDAESVSALSQALSTRGYTG